MFYTLNLLSESIDFDIDQFTGYPIVLIEQDSNYIIHSYFASSSFTSSTITGLSNPKSIALYNTELIIIDGTQIKRYDKSSLFYLDTIKLNTALNPSKIIKKDLNLIVIDDTLQSVIEFNKNMPYNETTLYSSSITNPKSISYNSELSNLTVLDENQDTTYSIKVINTDDDELLDSIYLSYLKPNAVIEDNYSSIIYTSNYSNLYAILKDDSTMTNQYFIPAYELKAFKNSTLDSNEIIVLDKDADTLIYYDYRSVSTPDFLYPDSTTLITKYGIGLGVGDFFNNNKYQFQLSTSESFTSLMIDTVMYQSNIELDSIFDYNSTYYWRAKCLNIYDESSWSESASFSIFNLGSLLISNPINDSNLVGNKYNIILSDTLGQFEIQTSYSSTFGEIYSSNTITNEYYLQETMLFDSTIYLRARMIDDYTVANWSPTVYLNSGSITIPNLTTPTNNSTNIDESSTFSWLNSDYAKYRIQYAIDSNFYNTVYNSLQDENEIENVDFTFKDTLYWRVRLENESQFSEWSNAYKFICKMNEPEQIYPLSGATMVGTMPVFEWFDNKDAYEFRIKNVNDAGYDDTTFIETKLTLAGIVLEKDSIYEWGVRGISYSSGTIYSNWNTSTFTVSDIENLMIMPITHDNGFGLVGDQMNTEDYFTEVVNYQNAHIMMNDRFYEQNGIAKTNLEVNFSKTFSLTYFVKMGEEEYDENGGNLLATVFMPIEFEGIEELSTCSGVDIPYIAKYLGIELDTYNDFATISNAEYEPDIVTYSWDVDHFSVFAGPGNTPLVGSSVGDFFGKTRFVNALKNQENIEDGSFHCVKLDWEPITEVLSITFDGELRSTYDLTGQFYSSVTSDYKSYLILYSCTGTTAKNRIEVKIGEYIED